jgi:hypothetical protein
MLIRGLLWRFCSQLLTYLLILVPILNLSTLWNLVHDWLLDLDVDRRAAGRGISLTFIPMVEVASSFLRIVIAIGIFDLDILEEHPEHTAPLDVEDGAGA